jgi:hypothetical protein
VTGRLPRSHRYTVGQQIENTLIDALRLLVKAPVRNQNDPRPGTDAVMVQERGT